MEETDGSEGAAGASQGAEDGDEDALGEGPGPLAAHSGEEVAEGGEVRGLAVGIGTGEGEVCGIALGVAAGASGGAEDLVGEGRAGVACAGVEVAFVSIGVASASASGRGGGEGSAELPGSRGP